MVVQTRYRRPLTNNPEIVSQTADCGAVGAPTSAVLKPLPVPSHCPAYWKLVEQMKKDCRGFQAKGNFDSPRIGNERQVTVGLSEK